jgi:hypothetical protein
MKKNQITIIENLDWSFSEYDGMIEFSKYSPAGEDFSFCVSSVCMVDEIQQYYNDFDEDEHIEMWAKAKENGVSGIPSFRELVEDADAIKDMLEELAIALANT